MNYEMLEGTNPRRFFLLVKVKPLCHNRLVLGKSFPRLGFQNGFAAISTNHILTVCWREQYLSVKNDGSDTISPNQPIKDTSHAKFRHMPPDNHYS